MSRVTPVTFPDNAAKALNDPELGKALRTASQVFSRKRQQAVDALPDWEQLRDQASAIKTHTLERLDHYLGMFAANAEAAGASIHWAIDARTACRIVSAIVQAGDGVVKSKSMTTEEIELNRALTASGAHPVETDLGEWIIQLADEPPSHIIAPAIHKTRRQVAQLFHERLGIQLTDDILELTAVARRTLRSHFKDADVGISGVNFAIAETGSIVIIENEGNARLTTSLPRVHVAVMGMEKVIPRLADLDTFFRILPRSGTGQSLTSYQSIITGPEARPDRDGPRALHIVVLDNGRSRMLSHATTRQALACIRCGACLNVCPVYQQIGGHAYGAVYAGPIGSVVTPQLEGLEKAHHLPFASTLCGACRDVCPVKIDIPRALVHLRTLVVEGSVDDSPQRGFGPKRFAARSWSWTMSAGWRYRLGARMARWIQRIRLFHILPGARRWATGRTGIRLADRSFREIWLAETRKEEGRGP
jgi:L-lactate dehydrogenase complex protein LldF